MKINTKIRYGLRMVAAIAQVQGVVNTTELGKQLNVSPKYLRKLAGPLERAQIIASVQGVYGGYRLNRLPKDISLKMIWDAFNERLTLVNCLEKKACPLNDGCITKPVWEKLDQLIEREFMTVTIGELMNQHHQKGKSGASPTK